MKDTKTLNCNMRFLLNEKIEIIRVILEDNGNGGFYKYDESIGDFFASVKIYESKEDVKLFAILRNNPLINGNLIVNYKHKIYEVTSFFEVAEGFLKLICKVQKH